MHSSGTTCSFFYMWCFLSYLEYTHDNPPLFLSVFRVALIGDEDRYQNIWFYYICWSSIATVLLYHKHVFYFKSAQIPKGVCFTIYITHIVLLSVLLLLSRIFPNRCWWYSSPSVPVFHANTVSTKTIMDSINERQRFEFFFVLLTNFII